MSKCAPVVVLSKQEWERLNSWTKDGREDPEAARRQEYLKFLNETSKEMTRTWPNSLENVNKRNEELRKARADATERNNAIFYKRYVKLQKEKQERVMYTAKDTVFKQKDAPKMLLGAVIESAVQHERDLQLKFKKEVLAAYAEEQKRLSDEAILRNAKEWHELHALKKQRKREINKAHQQELVAQAKERADRERMEHEKELQMQCTDIKRASEEMANIKKFEEEQKEKLRLKIWRANEQSMSDLERRRAEERARDELDDKLIAVLERTQAICERRRRETIKNIRDEKLRVVEGISASLRALGDDREAREQAILDKALREKAAAEKARYDADAAKKAQYRQERIDANDKFLKEKEQRDHEVNVIKQWEIINRFKNKEIYDNYLATEKEKIRRRNLEHRDEVVKFREERRSREERERQELRDYYGPQALRKLRDADNKLLTHGAALLDEADRLGRPKLPIIKAIRRYCKLYGLFPAPALPKPLQRIFPAYAPRDTSHPDAGYVEPPPPPPPAPDFDDDDTAHDEEPASPPPGKTNGLQDVSKAGPSKPVKKPETNQDYKRSGPANGLQRRPEDATLPAIEVIPCKTADCKCELKPKEKGAK